MKRSERASRDLGFQPMPGDFLRLICVLTHHHHLRSSEKGEGVVNGKIGPFGLG